MTAPVAVAASRAYVEVWRTKGCAAFEAVFLDEDGVTCSELFIWNADGNLYREVIGGVDLTTIRRDWEAASPFDKVQVPDDAGRKAWTHLDLELEPEPEPAPEPAPEPEPEIPPVADDVARAARTLAIQIWGMGSMPRAELAPANDQCLAHAVHENWLVVDAGGRIVRGGVDPRPVTITRIPNWT